MRGNDYYNSTPKAQQGVQNPGPGHLVLGSRLNAEERERRPGLSRVVATGGGDVGYAHAAEEDDGRIA